MTWTWTVSRVFGEREDVLERHDRWKERGEKVHNVAEVNIAKQRHGPVGTVQLQFSGIITKFSNLAQEDHLPDSHS